MRTLTPAQREELGQQARAYLTAELRERAPERLYLVASYDEAPLAEEGLTALFSFSLSVGPGAGTPQEHYVVVGQTTPNYYPAYDLRADDVYSLHIGTLFALTVGLTTLPLDEAPPEAGAALRAAIRAVVPDVEVDEPVVTGLFRCEDETFAVYRVRVDGTEFAGCGADCPPGVYHRPDLPPAVVLRWHLGRLIRGEGEAAAE